MTYEKEIIEQLMLKLQDEQKQAFAALPSLPAGRLHKEIHDGRTYFYHIEVKGKERTRKGITKNRQLVYQLARKEYLLSVLKKHEYNLQQMNKIYSKMSFYVWQDAAATVREKYPSLPIEVFIQGDQYQPYPPRKSKLFMNGTIHRTHKGDMVRSKSELIIAEMLESVGIPYQYEIELPYDDYHLCPDFTLIRPRDGKVIFWEHFGMTHDEEYLRKMDLKLVRYRELNIQPWNNLIISYDREDGSLDVVMIRALIDGWLK